MAKASTNKKNTGKRSTASKQKKGTSSRTRKPDKRTIAKKKKELKNEVAVIASVFFGVLLLLSNFGLFGMVGGAISSVEKGLFGIGSYLVPVFIILAVVLYVKYRGHYMASLKLSCALLSILLLSGVFELMFGDAEGLGFAESYRLAAEGALGGGALGGAIAWTLKGVLGTIGAYLLLFCIFLVCVVVITERSVVNAAKQGAELTINAARNGRERYEAIHEERAIRRRARREEEELRRKELSFPDVRGMDTAEMADKADIYARYGRDIIEDSRDGAEAPDVFDGEQAGNDPEANIYDTGVIGEIYDYAQDSVPFEEDKEERYRSYAHIAEGHGREEMQLHGSHDLSDINGIELDTARLHGYAVSYGEEDEAAEPAGFEPESVDAFKPIAEEGRLKAPSLEAPSSGQEGALYEAEGEQEEPERPMADEIVRTAGGKELSAVSGYERDLVLKDKLQDEAYKSFTGTDGEAFAAEGVSLDKGADEKYAAFSGTGSMADEGLPKAGKDGAYAPAISKERTGAETASQAVALGAHGAAKTKGAETKGNGASSNAAVIKKEIKKKKPYRFPPKSLLDQGSSKTAGNKAELMDMARNLEQVLKTFGVGVTVKNVTRGPSVTRYEMVPDTGVSVSKITSRLDDIKLTLAASDVRMEAPIPGKAAVGIEVPNKESSTVYLKEIICSPEFEKAKSKLSFAIGRDIQGRIMIGDIAKMPHLLIAGTTGSGKSVGINSLIVSLMYKASPEDVRMIMIDPKMVELSPYNGIPHLLIPVVTEPKKAVSTLNWAVAEMTDRYAKFTESGAKNLESYNERIDKLRENLKAAGEEAHMEELPQKLPQIVIIIDELAELMMSADKEVNSKDVEADISRLAQAARAAGMHLIIATQRPSVNVITGVIKANIPSRIAYKTSSAIDSRTILDGAGAETLIGHGDMLYLPIGASQPVRIQGAFVSEDEIERVVDFVSKDNAASYEESVESSIANQQRLSFSGGEASVVEGDDRDELFYAAGKLVTDTNKATIGMLQRRFKIGFNRAARIMDQLCEAKIVGEEEGTKPRKVLMTKEEYEAFSNGRG